MEELYSKKVLQYFRHPKNMGIIKNPDAWATVGNPICGDVMKLYIKIKKTKDKEIIDNIKFQTLGCAAAIATSSIITEMVKGKTLAEGVAINNGDIAKALGGLPKVKMHCSVLAAQALKKAIKSYQERTKNENNQKN